MVVPANSASPFATLGAGGAARVSCIVISIVCLVLALVGSVLVVVGTGSQYWVVVACFLVVPSLNLLAVITKNHVLHFVVCSGL